MQKKSILSTLDQWPIFAAFSAELEKIAHTVHSLNSGQSQQFPLSHTELITEASDSKPIKN